MLAGSVKVSDDDNMLVWRREVHKKPVAHCFSIFPNDVKVEEQQDSEEDSDVGSAECFVVAATSDDCGALLTALDQYYIKISLSFSLFLSISSRPTSAPRRCCSHCAFFSFLRLLSFRPRRYYDNS